MGRLLNVEYACIQGSFWMFYSTIGSFASVFLLGRGYTNSEIGVILAAGNIVAVVLQPFFADFADRNRQVSLVRIIEIITAVMMVLTVGLCVLERKTLALAVIFILLLAWHTILQPLLNSLCFRLEECGEHVNFGVARSIGSLGYAILVAILGTLVERFGVVSLPISGEIVLVMMMISLILVKKQYDGIVAEKKAAGTLPVAVETEAVEEINLKDFLSHNKMFIVVNVGVMGVYFSNQVLNSFMIQVVNNVGGNSEDMGRILSFMVFLEMPAMIFFDGLRKHFSCQTMLKVAALGFTVKIALCYLANGMTLLVIAQCFQLVAFGLFLPAMVHFIDEIMSRGEAVKGQAVFTMMVTVTSMVSSLIGGVILDASGAKMLLLISTLVTAAGAAVIIASVDKVRS